MISDRFRASPDAGSYNDLHHRIRAFLSPTTISCVANFLFLNQ
ncbi:hypothetical protein R69608_03271 [Paraburkholderia nemoris]|nr:hypothetical protein R69608_03271 [Paraburkholderia nemoris]